MKYLWYQWRGSQHKKGVAKAHHPQSLQLKLWQQKVPVRHLKALPTLGRNRLRQLDFWASWFHRWHTLISNGFDLMQSVQHLQEQSRWQEEAELSQAILQALYQGVSFTSAFKRSAIPLPTRYLKLMEFAEQAGQFEQILAQLSETSAQVQQAARQLKQALIYPSVVFVLVCCLALALQLFILPKFAALYADTNAQLPVLTQFILSPRQYFTGVQLLAVLATLGASLFLLRLWFPLFIEYPAVRHYLCQRFFWYNYIELQAVQQDLHALAIGLQQGMTLQQGILTIAFTQHSLWRRTLWLNSLQVLHLGQSAQHIFYGQGLSSAEHGLIELGEKSGTLEQKLAIIAHEQQQRSQQARQNFFRFIPQFILILVSIITGAVMIALYLPLFQLGLNLG